MPTINVSTAGQLDAAIRQIDLASQAGSGSGTAYTISIGAGLTLTETADLAAINLKGSDRLIIEGNGATLDGANAHRGLFVYRGDVTISDLTITRAVAEGGGASDGGGGGAGLGGALFIAGTNNVDGYGNALDTGGRVTLDDVVFLDNAASGGDTTIIDLDDETDVAGDGGGGGGGMGGMGGVEGPDLVNGGGGGGIGGTATGGPGGPNGGSGAGIVVGAASGGSTVGQTSPGGAYGGGGTGGNDKGNVEIDARAGSGGGVGGASSTPTVVANGTGTATSGGQGGFGGGGGGAGKGAGGDGGFGGGGGSNDSIFGTSGGDGGFGGGGGGKGAGGSGGFGGGDANPDGSGGSIGGGGLGAGGSIFVQEGGSLTIVSGSIGGGTVTAGLGGTISDLAGDVSSENGQAFASGLYMQGAGGPLDLILQPGAGQTVTISDVIGDDRGSAAAASYEAPLSYAPGSRGLVISGLGSGQVVLSAANTYSGVTTILGGTLVLDHAAVYAGQPTTTASPPAGTLIAGAAGTGAIGFNALDIFGTGGLGVKLVLRDASQPGNGATFSNTLLDFGTRDTLVLEDFAFTRGAEAVLRGSTLTVSSGGTSEKFTMSNPEAGTAYYVTPDAANTGLVVNVGKGGLVSYTLGSVYDVANSADLGVSVYSGIGSNYTAGVSGEAGSGVDLTLGNGSATQTALFGAGAVSFRFDFSSNTAAVSLTGGANGDHLIGGEGDDVLKGGEGNDVLVGGAGGDTINGGAGDDTATVNVSTDGADTVDLGEGNDRVVVNAAAPGQVRLTFTSAEVGNGDPEDSGTLANQDGGLAVRLQAEDDAGELTGPVSRTDDEGITFVAGTGVTFDVRDLVSGVQRGDGFVTATLGTAVRDVIEGTDGADYINGGGGDDRLRGFEGDDFLVGGAGNDTLEGGTGANGLLGGAGNDIYGVQNSSDRVIEAVGGGFDRVYATTSYTLAAGQEIELLHILQSTGTAALDIKGNEFGQTLVGNGGDNVLDGRGGDDLMTGGRGNDIYGVDSAGDQVIERAGAGFDRVYSVSSFALAEGQEIELLFLLKSTGTAALNLTGNGFGQTLSGNAGDNVLDGRGGADVLASGLGADTFVFSTALGNGNVDRLTDFSSADTIRLSADIFTALSPGNLDADAFKDVGTGATVDASDRIIYDSRTGALSYDADGSGAGAAVQFAALDNKALLTNAAFLVA